MERFAQIDCALFVHCLKNFRIISGKFQDKGVRGSLKCGHFVFFDFLVFSFFEAALRAVTFGE